MNFPQDCMNIEKTNDKPELRERIISAAAKLFQEHGIKQVRMDDVASGLGISKKTLYATFADKEAILLEVVKLTSESLCQGLKETLMNSSNVLEQIFWLYKRIIEHSREVNPLFFTELIRYAEVEAYFERMHAEHANYTTQIHLLISHPPPNLPWVNTFLTHFIKKWTSALDDSQAK